MNRGIQKHNAHRSNRFKNLSYLIGEPLRFRRNDDLYTEPDGGVRMIAEYPDTILLEMKFIESVFGFGAPPRKIRQMVPKASLVCQDVILVREFTGQVITGDMVAAEITDQELKELVTAADYE